jgi:uncharacterized protein involved in exopolysaccharide biosynthesis
LLATKKKGVSKMLNVVRAVERLSEIREIRKQLDAEEKAIREELLALVKSAGGRLIVGGYILAAADSETCQYGKVVEALRKLHPELRDELNQLTEKFKTTYSRLTIERLS